MPVTIDGNGKIGGLVIPAFRATATTSTQSIAHATFTKVNFPTEIRDTDNCYDPALSRFTAPVDGDYQLNATLRMTATNALVYIVSIYKNGAEVARGGQLLVTSGNSGTQHLVLAETVYLQAGDYVEVWGYMEGTSPVLNNSATTATTSRFSGHLVRRA
jgi:hypothetical protein